MKKSYIKLTIFIFITTILLLLNSFVFKVIDTFYLSLLVLMLLLIFKFVFGFEKDRHSNIKEITFQVIIFLLCFFLIYYVLGIFISFVRIKNYFTLYGIKNFIFPIILYTITKEILRNAILVKSSENKFLIVITTILFIVMDNTIALSVANLNTIRTIFMFVALTFLPLISQNIVCTFLSLKYGYKPNLVYLLTMNLYAYIIPIIPNPNEYLYSIIQFLLPMCMLYSINNYITKYKDEELTRDYNFKLNALILIPTLMIIVIVYFTSGQFKYNAIAIMSGSMEPTIYKGDVVISKKIRNEEELEEGKILVYNYGEKIIVHRINKILKLKSGELVIYTKGDNNTNVDNYKVTYDMVIGTVSTKIPLIGYPTVMLSELK